jgi:hypothetical protein
VIIRRASLKIIARRSLSGVSFGLFFDPFGRPFAAVEPGTLVERLGSEPVCEDRSLCIIDVHQRLSLVI